MLSCDSKSVECRQAGRLPRGFHIELRTDMANEFRSVPFRGKHSAQKKQIACLHRFYVGAERLRWHGKLDAKFFQPLFGGDPLESPCELPFAKVCTAVDVQHLPCDLPSFCQVNDRAGNVLNGRDRAHWILFL
jgi:hypothetical protein